MFIHLLNFCVIILTPFPAFVGLKILIGTSATDLDFSADLLKPIAVTSTTMKMPATTSIESPTNDDAKLTRKFLLIQTKTETIVATQANPTKKSGIKNPIQLFSIVRATAIKNMTII